MEAINFIGENLLPGLIGKAAVYSAFFSALAAIIFFGLSIRKSESKTEFVLLGTWSYHLHTIGVLTTIGTLFYILNQHLFEYNYAFSHTAVDLPFIYQFSSFWEGQEGSILLWMFWQSLIGIVILHSIRKYKAETMMVYTSILFFLNLMLLGLEIAGSKIGLAPFALLREVNPDESLFTQANYLEMLTDGNGLNPLLQNYWMVIHPPTLFFGFALMAPPFVYTIVGLWKKDFQSLISPVLRWSLMGAMVLGLGVLMGGAWAYEALSFGGFWAWDPVENASIFPWLIIVAAIHTLFIYKHTGRSLKFTVLLLLLTFIMVIYSSFLTRSGILGETSVHSFADNGLMSLLLLYLGFFTVLALGLFIYRWKTLTETKEEETLNSREFWLFVGGIVFFLSWVQILFSTSIPVINKVLSLNIAPPIEVVSYYNKWQLPFGMFMALLSGAALYFKYKKTDWKSLAIQLSPFLALGLVATIIVNIYYPFEFANNALLFASLFCTFSSLYLFLKQVVKSPKKVGAALTHTAFGILLVGVVISNGQKEVISINQQNIAYGKGYDAKENRENTMIYKGSKAMVGDYLISYDVDSFEYENHFFELKFQVMDIENKSLGEPFYLYPYVQDNPKFGKSANPDTKHYWNFDIFTYVTSAYHPSLEKGKTQQKMLSVGDTIFSNKMLMVLQGINPKPEHEMIKEGDIAIGAKMLVIQKDTSYTIEPICLIRGNHWHSIPVPNEEDGYVIAFNQLDTENNQFMFSYQFQNQGKDFIILKAIIFPWINLVWLGSILMTLGFLVSLINRIRQKD